MTRGLVVGLMFVMLMVGCISHKAIYRETAVDGTGTELIINETNVWGKSIWNGQAEIIVDASGAYNISIGQSSETDSNLQFMTGLMIEAFQAGLKATVVTP